MGRGWEPKRGKGVPGFSSSSRTQSPRASGLEKSTRVLKEEIVAENPEPLLIVAAHKSKDDGKCFQAIPWKRFSTSS
jgi:hypothetical protein